MTLSSVPTSATGVVRHTAARLRRSWHAYWYGPNFEISLGVCRVALCLAMYALFQRDAAADPAVSLARQSPALYDPPGLLRMFGDAVPPPAFFAFWQTVFRVSILGAILGVASRISLFLSVFSLTILSCLLYSFSSGWSHGEAPILLAGIAMLFAGRSPLSVDGLARRWVRRGSGTAADPAARRPVLLAQLAVCLMLFNAGAYKLYLGNGQVGAWVCSDSMRNLLSYQYWILREPPPSYVQFAIDHGWAAKGLALANAGAQLLPLAACFLIGRPLLRAACGLFFVFETLGLGLVMQIWNAQWCLLYAFFIDWDRLVSWARRRPPFARAAVPTETRAVATEIPAWSVVAALGGAWTASYLIFYVSVAFNHKQQHRYTYPFTSFPMYSTVYANPPYSEHLPYHLTGSTWSFDADPPLPQEALDWVWRNHYFLPWVAQDPHETVKQIRTHLEQGFLTKISGIRLEKTSFAIMPYPSSEVRPSASAQIYEMDALGGHRYLGSRGGCDPLHRPAHFVDLAPRGYDLTNLKVAAFVDRSGPARPLEFVREGSRLYFDKPSARPDYIVFSVRDEITGAEQLLAGPLIY